jgi:hypothetical protein
LRQYAVSRALWPASVIEENIYVDMRAHLYVVERA